MCASVWSRSQKLKVFKKIQKYLNKKTSIEFILEKLMEFEKSKFALFKSDEITGMKLLSNPNIKCVTGGNLNSKIQEMWKKNEISTNFSGKDIGEFEESVSKSDTRNLTQIQKNIIELLV